MLRALNRNVEPVLNPDRKDTHWGKRKLKQKRARIIHIPRSGGDRKTAALDQGEDLVFPGDDAGKRVRLG
jgi:hypothetical protein